MRPKLSVKGTKMKIKKKSCEDNSLESYTNNENDYGEKMEPYRTEWMVWDKDLKLAGSIDMIFKNEDGTLSIYDWKRCKEIKKYNRFESAKTDCVKHLPNTNYWHYSLQLNTYKFLLEKNYGHKIKEMYLVCLHPNNNNKSYQRIEVKNMEKEISNLMKSKGAIF